VLELLPKIIKYKIARATGLFLPMPINYTISLLYSCNSRCSTCNIYKKKAKNLTLSEYRTIFKHLGKSPYWITFSGGEPFLREDIAEICKAAYDQCRPRIINIPTNGILTETIISQVEAMTMADKIVIMKDGIIHQIDTPLNVYNKPVNLFVAGFIGSPAINQFKGMIEDEKGSLKFVESTFSVKIPDIFKPRLASYTGKQLIMGLRPEDVYDAEFDTMAEIPERITVLCDVVEPMGNEYVVYLSTGKATIIARFDPKKLPEVEKNMEISLDMKKAQFFDPESEDCLTYQL